MGPDGESWYTFPMPPYIIVSKGPESIYLPTYLAVILMTTTNGSEEGRAANIT